MKIAWCTDIHLDFVDGQGYQQWLDLIQSHHVDALLITGDISIGPRIEQDLRKIATTLNNLPIYFVLGNHDYHHCEIQNLQKQVRNCCREVANLHWLDESDPFRINSHAALIGHSGWGDARNGDFLQTFVRLSDHRLIQDFIELDRPILQKRLQALGSKAAQHIQSNLHKSCWAKEIWIMTHVPPFPEAAWHNGEWGTYDWIPDFTCKAIGDVLLEFADQHPNIQLHVRCGHGHSAGSVNMRPNLHVVTGAATYGSPIINDIFNIV